MPGMDGTGPFGEGPYTGREPGSYGKNHRGGPMELIRNYYRKIVDFITYKKEETSGELEKKLQYQS